MDFAAVDLIEHLVSSPVIEIVRNITDSRLAITVDEGTDSFKPLADGIFAAGK